MARVPFRSNCIPLGLAFAAASRFDDSGRHDGHETRSLTLDAEQQSHGRYAGLSGQPSICT